MRKSIRNIIAAVLCSAMLCSCSGQGNSEAVPENQTVEADSSTAVVSGGGITAEEEQSQAESTSAATVSGSTESAPPEEVNTDSQEPEESPAESTSENTTGSSAVNSGIPADTTSATTKTATTATSKPTPASKFSLDWKLSSTWEEGGKKCGGYEVTITNNSGSAVSSWTVELTVPSGFEITSGWNGKYTISGTKLTVKNESYNGEIANGGTAGFGFNYSSPSEFKPGKATVNGSSAGTGSGSGSGNSSTPESTTAASVVTVPPAPEDPKGSTPVATHGQLSVKGTQLVDKNGNGYQLRGMSTHGITWFPDFINENSFRTLRDDWNTNVVRLAMYVDEWGNGQCYMKNKDGSRQLLEKGVDICIKLGMYVIIDWHVLNPGDPTAYTDEAISFFNDMSKKYADYPNIIYEIVNEPNGNATWSGVIKPYAEKVIPVIRKNDKDAVIIVGTPTWSQDIDQALADPLDYDNVMYALHFYAATHTDWLRERTEKCVAGGLPIFVSEFGCCDASGNGGNNFGQTEKWLKLLDKYGISYCNWNLANKNESSSCFRESAKADGNWSDSDYSEGGAWIRKWFRNH